MGLLANEAESRRLTDWQSESIRSREPAVEEKEDSWTKKTCFVFVLFCVSLQLEETNIVDVI